MSTPYFCTLCGRQHVRGKIYADHADYKRGADCPAHDEQMTIVNPTKNVTPARCLDCGVPFENQDNPSLDSWFECSECGATHVYWKGKWGLNVAIPLQDSRCRAADEHVVDAWGKEKWDEWMLTVVEGIRAWLMALKVGE